MFKPDLYPISKHILPILLSMYFGYDSIFGEKLSGEKFCFKLDNFYAHNSFLVFLISLIRIRTPLVIYFIEGNNGIFYKFSKKSCQIGIVNNYVYFTFYSLGF